MLEMLLSIKNRITSFIQKRTNTMILSNTKYNADGKESGNDDNKNLY